MSHSYDNDNGSHPGTIKAEPMHSEEIAWDDHATVHLRDDGQGVLDPLKAIHRGMLAEMVALVSRMPAEERGRYVIQKSGDHQLGSGEIVALAGRPDFPG